MLNVQIEAFFRGRTLRRALVVLLAIGYSDTSLAQSKMPEISRTPGWDSRITQNGGQRSEYEFDKYGGIEYSAGENYRLTLDVYVPQREGPGPALLVVHGGAWRSGTKLNWFRHARKLARAGFVVVAINYRHAPEFPFPAQIHDCKAAVRWMRNHADDYHIDPQRIGAIGYSAGGQLAALLATSDALSGLEGSVAESAGETNTRVQAVAIGGAPCDLNWIDPNSTALNYWLGASRNQDPQIWKQASPQTWLTADDPPMYFFHGSRDWMVPPESAEAFYRQVRKIGIETEFRTWDNGHFGLFSRLESIDPVIEFFRRHLQD